MHQHPPADGNALCERDDCGYIAQVFGLTGNVKKRRCEQHVSDLTQKKMQIYDISAYSYISSSDDAARCESRRGLVETGLKNATILESCIELEMEGATRELGRIRGRTMQVVEMCFSEIEARLKQRYEEVKQQMSEMKVHLQLYLYSKEVELTDSEELMGKRMDFEPKVLQFALDDQLIPITKLIFSGLALAGNGLEDALQCTDSIKRREFISSALREYENHKGKGRIGLARESLAYAKALGHKDLKTVMSTTESGDEGLVARELVQILPMVIDADTVKSAAISYLHEGLSERANCHYAESLSFFQTAWRLLESKKIEDSERSLVGIEFAHTLSVHFSLFSEARIILKESLDIERKYRPNSKEDLSISNELIVVDYLSGEYAKIEQDCTNVLYSYAGDLEGVWTSALYLVWAYKEQGKNTECEGTAAFWQDKLANQQAKYAKLLSLCLLAELETQHGNTNFTESLYQKARQLASEHYSPSIIETEVNRQLGALYQKAGNMESAQKSYSKAIELYELHYPNCMQAADTYRALANVYCNMKKIDLSMAYFQKACEVYAAYHAKTTQTAENYRDFAKFLIKNNDFSQAESVLTSAKAIHTEIGSQLGLAECIFDLGTLYEGKKELQTALTQVTEALNIWKSLNDEKSANKAQEKIEKLKVALNSSSIFSFFSSIFSK